MLFDLILQWMKKFISFGPTGDPLIGDMCLIWVSLEMQTYCSVCRLRFQTLLLDICRQINENNFWELYNTSVQSFKAITLRFYWTTREWNSIQSHPNPNQYYTYTCFYQNYFPQHFPITRNSSDASISNFPILAQFI